MAHMAFIFYDDSTDPQNPGWVLRHHEPDGMTEDVPLDETDPDRGVFAQAEAAALLGVWTSDIRIYPLHNPPSLPY